METELIAVVRDLAIAAIVYHAYKFSLGSVKSNGPQRTLIKGFFWCAGLALFAAVMAGQGECLSGDPMFGYCEERAESVALTLDDRIARFAYWFLLLFVPVFFGGLDGKADLTTRQTPN